MQIPSPNEILEFMKKESRPYEFEFVPEMQPLRISIERKTIYVNQKVLTSTIENIIDQGLDWKEVMRYSILHEKSHDVFYKWNLKWNVSAIDYGWLASFLIDIVIDKIHLKDKAEYQKWISLDYRLAYKRIKKSLWEKFPIVDQRPLMLYNQAACWVALGIISFEEAADLYPENITYIMELSELFTRIQKESDLEWAFPEAKKVYFERLR
jgi:hypothetical protein